MREDITTAILIALIWGPCLWMLRECSAVRKTTRDRREPWVIPHRYRRDLM